MDMNSDSEKITYSKILDDMVTYVAVLKPDGTILFMNRAPFELADLTLADVLGKKLYDTFWFSYSEEVKLATKSFIERCANGEALSDKIEVLTKNLTKIWINFNLHPVSDDQGNICYLVAEGRDITEQIDAEQKLKESQTRLERVKRLETIGQLAGGVAHDFNNMLSAIIGYTEIVSSKLSPDDPIFSNIQMIEKAAKRSADLTRQLLAFSRQEIINPKPLEINDIISNLKKFYGRLICEEIDLCYMLEKNIWKVKLDSSQVDRIVANLLINASHAMPNGGKLFIKTENITVVDGYCYGNVELVSGEFVMLTVSDNGIGMDEEILSHIFEPFYTTKKEGKGAGMGLATVYGIVRQNNGFIDVHSEPGNGTTFKIYFPRWTGEEENTEISAAKSDIFKTGTILLVEDDKMVRKVAEGLLNSMGHTVIAASSPDQAIAYCKNKNRNIHILLTDIVMPGMNGKELSDAVKRIRPGIKTIFMSGYPADIVTDRGVLEEKTSFINKPVTRDDLLRTVQELL